jgi:hypothetical protein
MNIYSIVFCIIFLRISCNAQTNELETPKINFQVNYNVIHKNDADSKKILNKWESFLNRNHLADFQDTENLSYWITTDLFPVPNRFLAYLGDLKEYAALSQVTVIALYPVAQDTYALKTMITYNNKIHKKVQLDNIITVYAIKINQEFKFMSAPQWYATQWNTKKTGKIQYFFEKSYSFNETNGLKMDSFNNVIAKKFGLMPLHLKYFVAKNVVEIYNIGGYDFTPEQFTYHIYGGFMEPVQKVIFSGNATEYYPHEVVHQYVHEFTYKNGYRCHQWFDEGIATFFGGSRGYPLEWHLGKLKTYLVQHPQEHLDDISQLFTIPNGEYITDYAYVIGGLICKKIYEMEGMNGLFELLKAGSSDADFYKIIEKKFNVKKENFGAFVHAELKTIKKI